MMAAATAAHRHGLLVVCFVVTCSASVLAVLCLCVVVACWVVVAVRSAACFAPLLCVVCRVCQT